MELSKWEKDIIKGFQYRVLICTVDSNPEMFNIIKKLISKGIVKETGKPAYKANRDLIKYSSCDITEYYRLTYKGKEIAEKIYVSKYARKEIMS